MGAGWTATIVSAREGVTAPAGVGEVVEPGGGSGEAEGAAAGSGGSHVVNGGIAGLRDPGEG